MAFRHVVKSSLTVLLNPNLQWGRTGEFHFSTNQPANPAVGVETPLIINKPSFSLVVGLLLNM